MSPSSRRLSAAQLARAFDASFSVAPEFERAPQQGLLLFTVESKAHAIRAREVSAVLTTPRLTRVPCRRVELLGVGSIRGELVPVFDLGQLLGLAPASNGRRWCLLVSARELVAFAFDSFERYEQVAESAIASAESSGGALVGQVARVAEATVPIINAAGLLSVVEAPTTPADRGRESA
ncbi:MAG: chemotaxis protein CheW [Myxococcota bacterium]